MVYFTFQDKACDRHNDNKITFTKRLFVQICITLFKPFIANPDFEGKFDYVSIWYIEYDEKENCVNREIGTDYNGNTITKAPYKKNIGLWCDEDLTLEQFKKFGITEIKGEQFEEQWQAFEL